METWSTFSEAVKRIRDLVDLAERPARRETARLSSEAEPVRESRATAMAEEAQLAVKVGRLGWVPGIGRSLKQKHAEAEKAAAELDRKWQDIRSRARSASDLITAAKEARKSVEKADARIKRGGVMPKELIQRSDELNRRAIFLEQSEGQDPKRALQLAPKAFLLATTAENIARAWDGQPAVPPPMVRLPTAEQAPKKPQGFNRPIEPQRRGKATQLGLDFDGTGQIEEEPRVWLPVSASRKHELMEMGARVDKDAKGRSRSSQLWVPLSERHNFDAFLPLAFRQEHTTFSFPPIRHNAVGQNLWGIFDKPSWNHIRTTAYDRAGHRCQICGKQGGSMWNRLVDDEERRKGGPVDCHEVWEWEITDHDAKIGIQRLKRLLVVCKDCHMMFHEGFAQSQARKVGLEQEVADYIKTMRMLVNRVDSATLDEQLSHDRAEWEKNKTVQKWVLDLSHLSGQDFMADHTMVLKSDNKANIGPEQIGGIQFRTEDGTLYDAQDANQLARGEKPIVSSGITRTI